MIQGQDFTEMLLEVPVHDHQEAVSIPSAPVSAAALGHVGRLL